MVGLLAAEGGVCNLGGVSLIACTVVQNSAGKGGDGGQHGPFYADGGPGGSGGGIYNATASQGATLYNTIVAKNSYGTGGFGSFHVAPNGAGADLFNPFVSSGHNLIGEADTSNTVTNGVAADMVGSHAAPLDPKLGPLGNSGGPLPTCAPLPISSAIDNGDDLLLSLPVSIMTDQRGFTRKSGAHVDIGATEFQPATTCLLSQRTILPDGRFTFGFSNSPDAAFSVVASYDATTPLSNWIELGPAAQISPGLFIFVDDGATNTPQRYYRVRSLY